MSLKDLAFTKISLTELEALRAEIARLQLELSDTKIRWEATLASHENGCRMLERLQESIKLSGLHYKSAVDEIAELQAARAQCSGNCRYWEGRWRDEAKENDRMRQVINDQAETIDRLTRP